MLHYMVVCQNSFTAKPLQLNAVVSIFVGIGASILTNYPQAIHFYLGGECYGQCCVAICIFLAVQNMYFLIIIFSHYILQSITDKMFVLIIDIECGFANV